MITAKHVNAQGLVALWEATDDGHRQIMLPSVDAAHALAVDPDRWSLEDPSTKESPVEQDVDLSATATQDEQTTGERSESEKGSG